MPSKKQRILGALVGVHAGDSLGATVEFSSWDDVRKSYPDGGPREIVGGGPFKWPAGHATDDTDMTRAVLLAYKAAAAAATSGGGVGDLGSSVDVARAAGNHMLDWYDGRWPGRRPGSRPVDIGGATRDGLRAFKRERDPRRAGAGERRAGNGSLMRCIPTALFAAAATGEEDGGEDGGEDGRRRRLLEESALISAITHSDWRCVLACAAYNVIARELVGGAAPAAAVEAGVAVLQKDGAVDAIGSCLAAPPPPQEGGRAAASVSRETLPASRGQVLRAIEQGKAVRVGDLARLGPRGAPGGPDALPLAASGYVLESLTLAVAAVLDTERSLEDLLVDVVRVGRDTDTNGAIAGGLLGARDGVDAVPAAWREKLQFGKEFAEIVDQLVPE